MSALVTFFACFAVTAALGLLIGGRVARDQRQPARPRSAALDWVPPGLRTMAVGGVYADRMRVEPEYVVAEADWLAANLADAAASDAWPVYRP